MVEFSFPCPHCCGGEPVPYDCVPCNDCCYSTTSVARFSFDTSAVPWECLVETLYSGDPATVARIMALVPEASVVSLEPAAYLGCYASENSWRTEETVEACDTPFGLTSQLVGHATVKRTSTKHWLLYKRVGETVPASPAYGDEVFFVEIGVELPPGDDESCCGNSDTVPCDDPVATVGIVIISWIWTEGPPPPTSDPACNSGYWAPGVYSTVISHEFTVSCPAVVGVTVPASVVITNNKCCPTCGSGCCKVDFQGCTGDDVSGDCSICSEVDMLKFQEFMCDATGELPPCAANLEAEYTVIMTYRNGDCSDYQVDSATVSICFDHHCTWAGIPVSSGPLFELYYDSATCTWTFFSGGLTVKKATTGGTPLGTYDADPSPACVPDTTVGIDFVQVIPVVS